MEAERSCQRKMMLVVKRRVLFLWVSTCSGRGGVRDVVAECAIAIWYDGWESW